MGVTPTRSRARVLARELRSPEWGLFGQGLRFAMVGGLVAVVYVGTTTTLHLAGLEFQIALALAFVASLVVHFTLQRLFVWIHHEQFALRAHHQLVRYSLIAGTQYGVTALSTSKLPGLLGAPVEVVYLVTVVAVALTNFIVFRGRVFHAGPASVTPVGAPITTEFPEVSGHSGEPVDQ